MNITINKKYKIELSENERDSLKLALKDTIAIMNEKDNSLNPPNIIVDFIELLEG